MISNAGEFLHSLPAGDPKHQFLQLPRHKLCNDNAQKSNVAESPAGRAPTAVYSKDRGSAILDLSVLFSA
jgi:hypothetical protein